MTDNLTLTDMDIDTILSVGHVVLEEWGPDDEVVTHPPILRQFGSVLLEALEQRFASGDKRAVLTAVRICAANNDLLPQWAAEAFVKAYESVRLHKVASWDDAFGRPHPKGTHLASMRKRRELRGRVFTAVNAASRDGRPIDAGLFEDVGEQLGIGKTLASELFYETRNSMPFSLRVPPKRKK
ncbi:hypothetical protein [Cognatilysobacter bugurensis]|uniref:Uncharacterized protein n=1 Tax=Cognatilysobacter bugurensis TaxID=543356 RepID=A0A918W6X1_9GAMM|nr:hypothetical protein [Lysobacter bugurensis]GHA74954.1 hypothetical protein GCM10007067_10020 [Lysobacter bugurensis]